SYSCGDETLSCNGLMDDRLLSSHENVVFVHGPWKENNLNEYNSLRDAGVEIGGKISVKVFKLESEKKNLESIGCCFNRGLGKAGCVLRFSTSQSSL
ncbi:hypothetical protein Y032_1265g3790, partial [Ancylostoma ceylanicum]